MHMHDEKITPMPAPIISNKSENEESSIDLSTILSETELVKFTQAFGGTRLYLPKKLKDGHPLVAALGLAAAAKLVEHLGYGTMRVPMARAARARHYRAQGLSHAKIARRLGMTEVGVERMFKRMATAAVR